MQDPNLNVINAFKFEKRLQLFVAVYLSIILLSVLLILVKINMTTELQQALIVILGLVSIATLDAFRKALDSKSFPLTSVGNQIIIREGGVYVGGDYVGRDINHAVENRQTLAEAASEIHKLLQELEKFNPTATEAEKVAYVNEEVTPAFKSRVASAVKETGVPEAAIEIQLLLQEMEKSGSTFYGDKVYGDKVAGNKGNKMMVDSQTSPLKTRIIAALKSGGAAALEEVLSSNPYASVATAVISGWLSSDEIQQSEPHNIVPEVDRVNRVL